MFRPGTIALTSKTMISHPDAPDRPECLTITVARVRTRRLFVDLFGLSHPRSNLADALGFHQTFCREERPHPMSAITGGASIKRFHGCRNVRGNRTTQPLHI
jgi:hypothetical protein